MKKIMKFVAVVVVSMVALTGYVRAEKFNEQNKVITANVTNGQTIVLSAPELRLTPLEAATLVVSPVYPIDGLILITCDHASSYNITLTDATTTLNLGGANRVIKPGQSILLKPVASNQCNMVGGSFFSTAGTVTLTKLTTKIYDSTGFACTNAALEKVEVVTNATATVTFTVP